MYIGLDRGAAAAPARGPRLLQAAPHARGAGEAHRRRRCRRRAAQGRQADGLRRLARCRVAEGVGRSRLQRRRAVHLVRRVDARRRAGADAHDQHRRSHDHELRLRRAEGVLPPEDPQGRDPLLHRVLRAGCGHRPRRAEHQGRARRRRVHHQRAEDVDEPRERRRLRVARGAHEPEREEAQGHLALRDPDGHAGHQGAPDPRDGGVRHQPGVLRGRARAGDDSRRRGERGLAADHEPAQPRARHAVLVGDRRARAQRRARAGRRTRSWPTDRA